jgi:hypothetical protein
MSDDMALQNFTMNVLNQMGTGGLSTGGSSGSSHLEFSTLDSLKAPSIEGMQKKVGRAFETFAKLMDAMQGAASQFTPSNLGLLGPQLNLPAGFIAPQTKMHVFFSSKG